MKNAKFLENFYLKKLNEIINYSRNKSPYYKKLFKKIDLPRKIKDFSQFESIPITTRSDLERKNDEFITVPRSTWADVVSTSGTTGQPIYMPFTKKDMLRNAYFIAKKFSIFGLRKDDIVYISVPIGQSMWIGGLSVWMGCFEIGACSLRAGNIGTDKHIEFIERFHPTVIFGLPSFVLRLGEELKLRRLRGISKPRIIVTFGENIMNRDFSRNSLGLAIERVWGTKIISGYCSSEVSPGFECIFQSGHHILPEMVYVEIVDPQSQRRVEQQEEGLVVITHFGREGLPLIRYANGDLSFLVKGKCRCGRTIPRLGPVLGRIDEMVKIKGVNIHPSQVETFLFNIPFIEGFLIELFTGKDLCDKMKMIMTFRKGILGKDKANKMLYLETKLKDRFGIKIPIEEMKECVQEETSRVKSSRVVDKRIKD
jgi:phenylacetate-CoA ligase